MHYIQGGAFRVRGGIQKIVDSLRKEFESYGGKIYLEECVSKVNINKMMVTSIETDRSGKIEADKLVSAMDLKTLLNSITKGSILNDEKIESIKRLNISDSFIIVYLGLDCDLNKYNLVSSMGYFSSFDSEAMLNRDEKISFGLSFPSLVDKTLSPSGHSSVVIHRPFCYNKNSSFPDKNVIADKLITQLEMLIPDIRKHIVYRSVSDASSLYRYTGNCNGAAYGWKQDTELFKNLALFRNIANNFYVVGHWSGYGGGIMPSMLSAAKVSKIIG